MPHRGSFLPLKEMELAGRTKVMVGLGPARAAVVVTFPDSAVLYAVVTGPGDRHINKERESLSLALTGQ